MTYRPDFPNTELPSGARTLVRSNAGRPSTGLFRGWGPTI